MTAASVDLGESDVLVAGAGELCEGPRWDARSERLVFVDILAGRVCSVDPGSGSRRTWQLGTPVGAVAPRRQGGWVAAVERGFALYDDEWNRLGPVVPAPGQPDGTRFNDGGCDSDGRFWAGTMSYAGTPARGSLYRLDPGGLVTEVLTGVTNSNGIGWTTAGDAMYYVDTGRRTLDVLDVDPSSGSLGNRRTLVAVPPDEGLPDGLAVDVEGHVWLGLWDGGCVRRYAPDGEVVLTLRLPVSRVTSVTFGGEGLHDLFITTAWEGLTFARRAAEPLAGSVFRWRSSTTGTLPHAFAG